MKDYIESLSNPKDYFSGEPILLPKELLTKHDKLASLEEDYHTEQRFYHKDERKPYEEALKAIRTEYRTELKEACETYLNKLKTTQQNNSDMSTKKTKSAEMARKR